MNSVALIILVIIVVLVASIAGLGFYNDYAVQRRAAVRPADPNVRVLRTPDARFEALTDFSFEPHYINIDDPQLGTLRVHYLDEGPANGEVILLLHGQATWSYSFRKMIPILTAAGYRVVVPDLVGFGRSDKPADWEDHSFQKQVDWLGATLTQLDLRGCNAFLFDWGGYFALRLLADDPKLFSRLILVTTTLPRANSLPAAAWVAGWRRYVYGQEYFPISSMVSGMTGTEIDADTVKGLDAPYPDESYKAGPKRMPMMIPATTLNPAARPNREAWKKLHELNGPAVTMVAESLAKRGFKPQEFHDLLTGTAGQPHKIYPGMGFFLIEDVPEELAAATIEFIRMN